MPQCLKRPSCLRIGVVLLMCIWYVNLANYKLGWLFLPVYILLAPLLLVAHWEAWRQRDWFSITLIGSFWGYWLRVGDAWWARGAPDSTAIAEWLRQVRGDTRYWLPFLAVAVALYLWRASRPAWQAVGTRLRVVAHAAALIGLVGFPMLLPSTRGISREMRHGGAGLTALYPTVVLSFTLLGAALRSPKALTAFSLRVALVLEALVVLATVAAISYGLLLPELHYETFWSSHIWTLFGTDELGIPFAALAIAWILLAIAARPERPASGLHDDPSSFKNPTVKEMLRGAEITEEHRKRLSPDDLAALERALKDLRENEPPAAHWAHPQRFDAKGMNRVGEKAPPAVAQEDLKHEHGQAKRLQTCYYSSYSSRPQGRAQSTGGCAAMTALTTHGGVRASGCCSARPSSVFHFAALALVWMLLAVLAPDRVGSRRRSARGDSDSIGTLAGALVGALVGVGALPEPWVRDLERTDQLAALAETVAA